MSSGDELLEKFQAFLPPYLSAGERTELFRDLSKFPDIQNFYVPETPEELLQGDGWSGFVAVDEASGERREVRGLLISNSCDVDLSNRRQLSPRVLFAPLVELDRVRTLLLQQGQTEHQADDYLSAMRRQHVTNVFYLPPGPYGPSESIAFLDNVRPDRLKQFLERERTRLFRLSLPGFYILILKLSIHFSRVQEGVRRVPA